MNSLKFNFRGSIFYAKSVLYKIKQYFTCVFLRVSTWFSFFQSKKFQVFPSTVSFCVQLFSVSFSLAKSSSLILICTCCTSSLIHFKPPSNCSTFVSVLLTSYFNFETSDSTLANLLDIALSVASMLSILLSFTKIALSLVAISPAMLRVSATSSCWCSSSSPDTLPRSSVLLEHLSVGEFDSDVLELLREDSLRFIVVNKSAIGREISYRKIARAEHFRTRLSCSHASPIPPYAWNQISLQLFY